MRITAEFLLLILLLLVGLRDSTAQADDVTPSVPCSSPEFAQFDFWIGEWDLTWADSLRGTNVITKEYDGCVIIEKFDGAPSMTFQGMSISTFNTKTGKWQQTWVDNSGGYLEFVGEFSNGKMILSRETVVDGKRQWQRMIWYNISKNSLDWNWEKSADNGQNWETVWHIHYTRRQ